LVNLLYKILNIIANSRVKIKRWYYIIQGAQIDNSTYISPQAYIDTHKPGKVIIGRNCYITRNVVILCHSDTKRGGPLGIWNEGQEKRMVGNVRIGDNVFIGVNSVIMPGVNIGDNVIVGALSLVINDIPEGKIVGGVPTKVIGETIEHS
jgi:maltose O-acetyltransferase